MSRRTTTSASPEPQAVDLHAPCQQHAGCGYQHDLHLQAWQVQGMAESLRGIRACAAVLTADADPEQLQLGDWLRCGLAAAVTQLAHLGRQPGSQRRD